MRAGHKACRDNRSVLYHRMPRLFEALALARGDGRHARLLKALSRVELLILDDWGLAPLTADQRRDLLEIVDDRHQRGSTIITSQVPVDHWHEVIADPPSPTPFSTVSSTTHTASQSGETACERSPPKTPVLTSKRNPDPNHHAGNGARRLHPKRCRLRSERVAAFNRFAWPQSSESATGHG